MYITSHLNMWNQYKGELFLIQDVTIHPRLHVGCLGWKALFSLGLRSIAVL